jgi:hypothetical protein
MVIAACCGWGKVPQRAVDRVKGGNVTKIVPSYQIVRRIESYKHVTILSFPNQNLVANLTLRLEYLALWVFPSLDLQCEQAVSVPKSNRRLRLPLRDRLLSPHECRGCHLVHPRDSSEYVVSKSNMNLTRTNPSASPPVTAASTR